MINLVRSVTGKYNLWIAGYYDDFSGARAIADDNNSPSATVAYDHTKTHYGNPMNGEATLNPRYRWSIVERSLGTNYDAALTGTNNTYKYLQNNGAFEWIGQDIIRQKYDRWEGKAQLQYPDGNVGNKYRYGGSGNDAYQLFTNGFDTLGTYIVPLGSSDCTFGRTTANEYTDTLYESKTAGYVDASYAVSFTQKANLIGTWMGETMDFTDADEVCPQNIFFPVTSPANKPFLAIQSYYQTAPTSGSVPSIPSIIYDGSLNSRADGDIFHFRVAVRSFNGSTSSNGNAGANVNVKLGFTSRIGTIYEDGFTHSSNTPAINFNLSLTNYDSYGSLYNGNATKTSYTNDTAWIDVDVTLDYTNSTYVVYQDGVQVSTASFTGTAANMYGYQITAYPDDNKDNSVITLLLDRVALYRPLTNHPAGLQLAPVKDLKVSSVVNGISQCKINISDDADINVNGTIGFNSNEYDYTLTPIFDGSITSDWFLLVFAEGGNNWVRDSRIDRPIWRGLMEKLRIRQSGRGRSLEISAKDTLSLLDRQVPLWEVGQSGLNDDESQNPYWLYDSQGFRNTMYFGVKPFKLLNNELGFDVDDSFLERNDQRMQLGSGHPIQMSINEDADGATFVEKEYEGVGIDSIGYTGTYTKVYMTGNPSYTGGGGGTSVSIINSEKSQYNISSKTPHSVGTYTDYRDNSTKQFLNFTQTDMPYQGAADIVYAGHYDFADAISWTELYNKITYYGNYIIRGSDTTPSWPSTYTASKINQAFFTVLEGMLLMGAYVQRTLDEDSTSETYTFLFDTDPNLEAGDVFRVPTSATPSGTTIDFLQDHTVRAVKEIMTYHDTVNTPASPLSNIYSTLVDRKRWVVNTNTPYKNTEYGDYETVSGLLDNNSRIYYESQKSIGRMTATPTRVADGDLTKKISQAVWMRDLPESLWFKYHFGDITTDSHIDATVAPNSITSNDTHVQISSATKTALDNANVSNGIAQLGADDLFIFKGVTTVSSNHYLVGCQFISNSYGVGATLQFPVIKNDYKHIWLLWSDMRNNGRGDADAGTRKVDFGLEYPLSSNYEVSLFFKDQVNNQGQKDLFSSLKIGEDIDIWNVDSTVDPSTGIQFSYPIDYDNPLGISGLAAVSGGTYDGKVEVTYTSAHSLSTSDTIYIYNSNLYDGYYTILNVPTTTRIIIDKTSLGSDTGKTGGILSAKTKGTSILSNTNYKNWHDKGGSFLVIDASKFFNINSSANNGKVGQAAGGKTTLGDYTATVRGFPVIIDNYWSEAIATSSNTGTTYLNHPNSNKIRNDGVFMSNNIEQGDFYLLLDSVDNFDFSGYGRIVALKDDGSNKQTKTENYFGWSDRNSTKRTGTVTLSQAFTATDAGYWELTDSSATFQDWGIRAGMYIINATLPCETPVDSPYGGSEYNTRPRYRIKEVVSNTKIKVELTFFKNDLTQTLTGVTFTGRTRRKTLTSWDASNRWLSLGAHTYVIPVQLTGVITTSASSISISADSSPDEIRKAMNDFYRFSSPTFNNLTASESYSVNTTVKTPFRINETNYYNDGTVTIAERGVKNYDNVSVYNTLAPIHLMDIMMYIDGYFSSRTSNTYYDHDKFRALWCAATMKTWMPKTRLSTTFDINNIPITENMSTDGGIVNIDSYGGSFDTRGKDLLKIISGVQKHSSQGVDNNITTTFSYLQGRDGRLDYRPKYNSGYLFTRNNLSMSDLDGNIAGKVENVRVYYKNGKSFVDYPKPNLTDTTRWKIVEHPSVISNREALSLAQKEYNSQRNTRLSIKASPIRATETVAGVSTPIADVMLDGGRFGYIADPQRVIQGHNDLSQADAYSWSRIGTGGVLFGGMVNALDGNINQKSIDNTTPDDIYNRSGRSMYYNGAASNDIPYSINYYWYGANSLSHAVQVVHIPKHMPKVSATTSEHLRVAISIQGGTTIDDAIFRLHLLDYPYSVSQEGEGRAPSLSINGGITDSSHYTYVDMKGSGFHEISAPTSYWNSSASKIVVSFNAEYCRALLRHRCGDPTAAAILKNAHGFTGDATIVTGNGSSIFPLGMRNYNEFQGYASTRTAWYAPRLMITDDVVYVPATYVTYTDKGLGLTDEVMTIQKVDWKVTAEGLEEVELRLERDESLSAAGIIPYLMSGVDSIRPTPPVTGGNGEEGNSSPVTGGTYSPILGLLGSELDLNASNPSGGTQQGNQATEAQGGGGQTFDNTISINQLNTQLYSELKDRANLSDSKFSHQNDFSILGQSKPSVRPSSMRSIEGLSTAISPTSGSLTVTNKGMSFGGAGHPEDNAEPNTTTSFFITMPEDVMSDEINISGKVTMNSTSSSTSKTGTLAIRAECIETGDVIENTISVGTNTEFTVDLIPRSILQGVSTVGNTVVVTISRNAGQGSDNANNLSINLNELRVSYRKASFFSDSDSSTFTN